MKVLELHSTLVYKGREYIRRPMSLDDRPVFEDIIQHANVNLDRPIEATFELYIARNRLYGEMMLENDRMIGDALAYLTCIYECDGEAYGLGIGTYQVVDGTPTVLDVIHAIAPAARGKGLYTAHRMLSIQAVAEAGFTKAVYEIAHKAGSAVRHLHRKDGLGVTGEQRVTPKETFHKVAHDTVGVEAPANATHVWIERDLDGVNDDGPADFGEVIR